MESLSGIITALVTPFQENGEVKKEAIKPLIDFQVTGGVDGVFLCGTAGSGPLMRRDQKVLMFNESVKAANGRINTLAHVGSPSTDEAVALAIESEKAGVSAIAAVPPYFIKPDKQSLLTYFRNIAESVSIPVYLYNIPRNALNAITPEMMIDLTQTRNIIGVKDSSRDFINVLNYLRILPKEFSVICGTDSYIYPAILMGAKGAITGYANGFPDIYSDFIKVINKGDVNAARDMQWKINVLRSNLQKPPLASHYEALMLRGVDAGLPRAPLRSMTDLERKDFVKRLTNLGVI